MVAEIGFGAFAMRCAPRRRAPVPQSKTNRWPAPVTASTHDVLPPKRSVPGPGVAIDPRVPQNRNRNSLLLTAAGRAPLNLFQVAAQLIQCNPNRTGIVGVRGFFDGRANIG